MLSTIGKNLWVRVYVAALIINFRNNIEFPLWSMSLLPRQVHGGTLAVENERQNGYGYGILLVEARCLPGDHTLVLEGRDWIYDGNLLDYLRRASNASVSVISNRSSLTSASSVEGDVFVGARRIPQDPVVHARDMERRSHAGGFWHTTFIPENAASQGVEFDNYLHMLFDRPVDSVSGYVNLNINVESGDEPG